MVIEDILFLFVAPQVLELRRLPCKQ